VSRVVSRALNVAVLASTVKVTCASCGESLLSPDGSMFWTAFELKEACDGSKRTCDSCDEPIRMMFPSKVAIGGGA
jgi:hypothetical protein